MTDEGKSEFERIVATLTADDSNVSLGKMMSSPGLKYGDKVFAFQAKEAMGFRLGRTSTLSHSSAPNSNR